MDTLWTRPYWHPYYLDFVIRGRPQIIGSSHFVSSSLDDTHRAPKRRTRPFSLDDSRRGAGTLLDVEISSGNVSSPWMTFVEKLFERVEMIVIDDRHWWAEEFVWVQRARREAFVSFSCPSRTASFAIAIAMALIQPAPKKDDDRDDDCKLICALFGSKMNQIWASMTKISRVEADLIDPCGLTLWFVSWQLSIRRSSVLRRERFCRKRVSSTIHSSMLADAHRWWSLLPFLGLGVCPRFLHFSPGMYFVVTDPECELWFGMLFLESRWSRSCCTCSTRGRLSQRWVAVNYEMCVYHRIGLVAYIDSTLLEVELN